MENEKWKMKNEYQKRKRKYKKMQDQRGTKLRLVKKEMKITMKMTAKDL